MCQTTHLKILGLVTFSDLTLTLTWAKYETISLVSTSARSLGVHMENFGRKMVRLRSLRSAIWKHPILTFDLTLTWHVTSILIFWKLFGSVSSRSFECRLVRLSTSIRFRDSRGGRIRPPPPRLWWVQKEPRRWRVNNIDYSFRRLSVVPKRFDREQSAFVHMKAARGWKRAVLHLWNRAFCYSRPSTGKTPRTLILPYYFFTCHVVTCLL